MRTPKNPPKRPELRLLKDKLDAIAAELERTSRHPYWSPFSATVLRQSARSVADASSFVLWLDHSPTAGFKP